MKKIMIYELTNDVYRTYIENECDEVNPLDPRDVKTKVCIFADKISSITQDDMTNLTIVTDQDVIQYKYVPRHYGFTAIDKIIDFIDDSTNSYKTLYLGINVTTGAIAELDWRL